MKTVGIAIAYGATLLISWEIQKFDLLLGHTIGVLGVLGITVLLADHLSKKVS